MRIADFLAAPVSERAQLWDAAIGSVTVDAIEHMNGNGEQQLEAFLWRMADSHRLKSVELGVFSADEEI